MEEQGSENEHKETESIKENRIRQTALSYYIRKDIQEAIVKFCENRETVPRYFEGFGKRPDYLQYPQDLLSLVKKGATSFHCSEELWKDPLQISQDLNQEEVNNLRIGYDLLIDIDCKWLEYSKKAAHSIIKALKFHGVENVNVKFSGSKGFHIIVPSKAFPKEMNGIETKNMFPDWPRSVCQYIAEVARPILEKDMENEDVKFLNKMERGIKCERCKKMAQKIERVTRKCPLCKREETSELIQEQKTRKCPDCKFEMIEKERKPFYKCTNCNINSLQEPESFQEKSSIDIFKVLGIDVVLVSSRHLFRAPYSLHEKTSLASIVLDKNKILDFKPQDADPLKVKPISFLPDAREGEARELLIQALDWQKAKQEPENKENKEYPEIYIKDLSPELYPPCIKKIQEGLEDGKKRALFILINFFRSLNLSNEEVEEKINNWNSKNKKPLKQGYIKSQLSWYARQKKMLPPNCDKIYYKDIQVCFPDSLCKFIKNPINYVIKKQILLQKKKK